ncbi:MAG TPA: YkvA family protein [Rhodothermales bacterium]|nr:YkvA family protein [Rhodothermales bacterium]
MASTSAPVLFERFRRRATREMATPHRVSDITRRAARKLGRQRGALSGLRKDLPSFVRLARAWALGEYRAIPWRSAALIVGALLYFVSPLDALPDFIPIAGFLDDAAVVGYVVRAIGKDLKKFQKWEKGK